jgi:hypothetical protein
MIITPLAQDAETIAFEYSMRFVCQNLSPAKGNVLGGLKNRKEYNSKGCTVFSS